MTLRVGLVTATRAEWGLMRPVAEAIRRHPDLDLALAVTGTHLSAAHGETICEIRDAGFEPAMTAPILAPGDDAASVAATLGNAVAAFGARLPSLGSDILIVPGDRYEMLGAAAAALVQRIPLAHVFGGDTTEGAFDEAIRHAITKMAHVHFATTEASARRVRQLGEDPANVHVVGSPGLDTIRTFTPLPRAEVFRRAGLEPRTRLVLVTFHPPTLDAVPGPAQMHELLAALDGQAEAHDVAILITGSNADTSGREMTGMAADFASARSNVAFIESLGHALYLSALTAAAMVVGNSSSGLYEAPSFGIPTVNIGDRQRGRLKAASVIDCAPERSAIAAAMVRAATLDCSSVVNPYGDGFASDRIAGVLAALGDPRRLLKKHFHAIEGSPRPW